MKVWAEISRVSHRERHEGMLQALERFGVSHKALHLTPEPADFEEALKDACKGAQALYFRPPFLHTVPGSLHGRRSLVDWLRARDALLLEDGMWWPKNHLYEALPKYFTLYEMPIDPGGGGMVLGGGGRGRTAVAALCRMGFKKVTLVDADEVRAAEVVNSLRQHLWGATLEHQGPAMLTHMAGSYSVVINSLTPEEEDHLKAEISYFNFLISGGIYADLKGASDPALMEEAERVGARLIYGAQITSLAEAHWLRETFDIKAPLKEISQALPQGLAAASDL